jgi:signal transduction histidine kinase
VPCDIVTIKVFRVTPALTAVIKKSYGTVLTAMRISFIAMRTTAYGAVLVSLLLSRTHMPWWMAALAIPICLWCSLDQWKRPDEAAPVMRKGVWAETALIAALAILLHSSELLFLFLSPLCRSCIHLNRKESLLSVMVSAAAILAIHRYQPTASAWLWGQLIVLASAAFYTSVLGMLLQEREAARRLFSLSEFEREQRTKDEERIRLAGQLHDQTGQYWASIIRALDVALAVKEGDPNRELFMHKAREAAMLGLQEMRQAVHSWHGGHQTPEQWMRLLEESANRIGSLTGIRVTTDLHPLHWHLLADGSETAEAIARAGIEAVTNAVKHGRAQSIAVKLSSAGGGASLVVADDGVGLDGRQTAGGLGLASMRRLAQEAGGQLDIVSRQGHGTTLFLSIPYMTKGETAS